jgi:hypothetical protein
MISIRRLLLGGAAVSVAAAGAFVAKPHLSKLVRPSLDRTYPLGVLQDEEMRGIVALGETLAAPEAIPPPAFFQEFVGTATQGQPGMLKEYQRGGGFSEHDGNARVQPGRATRRVARAWT